MPKIGPYTLHTLETGRFGLDGGAMFGVVPKPLWERRIAPDARNRIPLHMRCLLLEATDRLILIDNGLGDKYDAKFASLYAVDQETHNLETSLQTAGFSADEITDVVLTHLHFDHCGGSTTRDGDALRLTFPSATHHVQRAHWEWARTPNPRERASFFDDNLQPLADSGQLQLVDGAGSLFEGIDVLTVHGHTEAQQLVKVSGPEGTLVFVADLLPTHAHLRTAWVMGYDVRPLVSMEEKDLFLQEALENDWQLFFEHDPGVAVASLQATDRGIEATAPRTLDALW